MLKPKFPGMQHLARIIFRQFRRINFVAENGMPKMMQMNANASADTAKLLEAAQQSFSRLANVAAGVGGNIDITA